MLPSSLGSAVDMMARLMHARVCCARVCDCVLGTGVPSLHARVCGACWCVCPVRVHVCTCGVRGRGWVGRCGSCHAHVPPERSPLRTHFFFIAHLPAVTITSSIMNTFTTHTCTHKRELTRVTQYHVPYITTP